MGLGDDADKRGKEAELEEGSGMDALGKIEGDLLDPDVTLGIEGVDIRGRDTELGEGSTRDALAKIVAELPDADITSGLPDAKIDGGLLVGAGG